MSEFRAWATQLHKMYIVTLIDYEDRTVGLRDSNRGVAIADFDSVVRMESTGRKDKNDKEIFEGDLVKVKEKGVFGGEYVAVVEYIGYWGFFGFNKLKVKHFKPNEEGVTKRSLGYSMTEYGTYLPLGSRNIRDSLEVIGNIYENPELL